MRQYRTGIGILELAGDWDLLDTLIECRSYRVDGVETLISIEVSYGDPASLTGKEDAASEERLVRVMDAVFVVSKNQIRGLLPRTSYCPGAIAEWLWLALPIFFAPLGWEAVHASAVVRGGSAIVVVGESGAGKTTTTQEFLKHGSLFLSDDIVLVNPEKKLARGWDKGLHIHASDSPASDLYITVDFAGKLRVIPDQVAPAVEYPVSDIIVLGEPASLRHDGDGFDTAWIPNAGAAAWILDTGERWPARPADLAARAIQPAPEGEEPTLAVLTPFAGKEHVLVEWLEMFDALEVPPHTSAFWLCDAVSEEFYQKLRCEAGTRPNVTLWRNQRRETSKDAQVALVWRLLQKKVADADYVLCIEDDVLIPPHAVRRLLEVASQGAVVGAPVPFRYPDGHTAIMAWRFTPDQESVRDVVRATGITDVDALPFACTVFPRDLFVQLPLSSGNAYLGYDQKAFLAVQRLRYPVQIVWDISASHVQRVNTAVIRIDSAHSTPILVLGTVANVPDGPGWNIAAYETPEHVTSMLWRHSDMDFFLYVPAGIRVSTAFVTSALQTLGEQDNTAIVRARSVTARGAASPSDVMLCRMTAALPLVAETMDQLRANILRDGWKEVTAEHGVCFGRVKSSLGVHEDTLHQTASLSVLFTNRNPYRPPVPGFGGDMVHIDGYRDSLKRMGIVADFRPTSFSDYGPWNVIHGFHTQWDWAWAVAAHDRGTRPLVVSAITHGHPPAESVARMAVASDAILCYSKDEAAFYLDAIPGLPESKCRVVPMGVSEDIYHAPDVDASHTVYMAGRYCGYKNQKIVLTACQRLDVPVVFSGPRDNLQHYHYKDELIAMCNGWNGATFLGLLRGDELWSQYRKAHVHVNASGYEPYGIVTDEALASGCNIVHTQNSWVAERFAQHGSLCDPDDEDSVAAAIERELNAPRNRHGYHPPTWLEATLPLIPIYQELLA